MRAWQEGVRGREACMTGACVAGGMHDGGMHATYALRTLRSVNARAVRILLECILFFLVLLPVTCAVNF